MWRDIASDCDKRKKIIVGRLENHLALGIEVGYGCNLKCPYCYVRNEKYSKIGQITLGEQLKVLDKLVSIYDRLLNKKRYFLTVKIVGGEPTLYSDEVIKVISHLKSLQNSHRKIIPVIYTNGIKEIPSKILNLICDFKNGGIEITPHTLWQFPNSSVERKTYNSMLHYLNLSTELDINVGVNLLISSRYSTKVYEMVLKNVLKARKFLWKFGDLDNFNVDITHDNYEKARNPIPFIKYDKVIIQTLEKYFEDLVKEYDYSIDIYNGIRFIRDIVLKLKGYWKQIDICQQNIRYGLTTISKSGYIFACPQLLRFYDRFLTSEKFLNSSFDEIYPFINDGFIHKEKMNAFIKNTKRMLDKKCPNGVLNICPFVVMYNKQNKLPLGDFIYQMSKNRLIEEMDRKLQNMS